MCIYGYICVCVSTIIKRIINLKENKVIEGSGGRKGKEEMIQLCYNLKTIKYKYIKTNSGTFRSQSSPMRKVKMLQMSNGYV